MESLWFIFTMSADMDKGHLTTQLSCKGRVVCYCFFRTNPNNAIRVWAGKGHGLYICLQFLWDIALLVHGLEAVYKRHRSFDCWMCPSSLQMCLVESQIWKMTRANNLSISADWGAWLTFSTIAELQLSVHWPNPIESPYGQSNVIFQAFILCLQLHGEGPWRDGICTGQEKVWEQPLSKAGREIKYRTGLSVKYSRQGPGHAEGQVILHSVLWCSLCTVKHHWASLCYWLYWIIDLCFSSKGHFRVELGNRGCLLMVTHPEHWLAMLTLICIHRSHLENLLPLVILFLFCC